MAVVVLLIANAMIRETLFPDQESVSELFLGSKRKASLDELQGFFQGNVLGGRKDEMEMIGHDDEFVQQEAALRAIIGENVNQKASHLLRFEDWPSSIGHGCDEECADFLRGAHMPELKLDHFRPSYAALKGRSSTNRSLSNRRSVILGIASIFIRHAQLREPIAQGVARKAEQPSGFALAAVGVVHSFAN